MEWATVIDTPHATATCCSDHIQMELPQEIYSYLDNVYAEYSTDFDPGVQSLALALHECLSNLHSRDSTTLRAALDHIQASSHTLMSSSPSKGSELRQIYTDSCIVRCLSELRSDGNEGNEPNWIECIHLLDGAIVFSGAPTRMDIVQGLIAYIQEKKLKPPAEYPQELSSHPTARRKVSLPPCGRTVPRIEEPDMMTFLTTGCKSPFVISQGITHWPALTTHPWSSQGYLKGVAGGGRVVPVEIGKDYRLDNWGQEMMEWEEFLDKVETGAEPLVYLAQHSLLTQFPSLREDICVPDLVYYSPSSEYEKYAPPANEDGVIINAWLGPKGTVSPAHQDPYFNCYAQVVGSKTVWLAPPHFAREMYPLPSDSGLSNTTSLDVFSTITEEAHPQYVTHVLGASMAITLNPGDLLFFPPGWWHAMRSEEKSFSVSFWF